jgi:hyperosmotically inducible periplasmic protein
MVLGPGVIRRMTCLILLVLLTGIVDIVPRAIAQDPAKPEAKGAPGQEAKPEPKGPSDVKPPDAKPPEPARPDAGKPDHAKVVSSPILTIKLALMADPRLFPYDINVEMTGEAVTLTGKVPQDSHKVAAGEIARGIVKAVTNNLELDKSLDREVMRKKDDAITHYVKERFAKSKTLEKADFAVKTEDGVVSLSGKTRFQVIVLEAAEAGRQVPGGKAGKTDGVRLEAD